MKVKTRRRKDKEGKDKKNKYRDAKKNKAR